MINVCDKMKTTIKYWISQILKWIKTILAYVSSEPHFQRISPFSTGYRKITSSNTTHTVWHILSMCRKSLQTNLAYNIVLHDCLSDHFLTKAIHSFSQSLLPPPSQSIQSCSYYPTLKNGKSAVFDFLLRCVWAAPDFTPVYASAEGRMYIHSCVADSGRRKEKRKMERQN